MSRIKDLTRTITTPNDDDYIAIDGSTQGTGKQLAKAPKIVSTAVNPIVSGTDIAFINNAGKAAIKDSTKTRNIAVLDLPNDTSNDLSWVIKKNGVRFLHNFNYGNNGTVTTDGNNLFLGNNAGNFTMGSTATQSYHASYNIGIGTNNQQNNTSGYRNISLGHYSLVNNSTGPNNIAIGGAVLYNHTNSINNIAIGSVSLFNLTSGSSNIVLGTNAGVYISDGSNLTTMDQSILIGEYAKPLANNSTNEIVIGHNAIGAGNNSVVLGNTSITKTILRGYVAFGVSDNNPTAKVDIQGSTGYNQLRLRTSYTPTSSADTNGNVGDITWGDNYIYVKTTVGWKRSALTTF